jgi:hypothetical protein
MYLERLKSAVFRGDKGIYKRRVDRPAITCLGGIDFFGTERSTQAKEK